MRPSPLPSAPRPSPTPGWMVAVGAALATAVLAALPPFVTGTAQAGLLHGFSFLCHQLPERSFAVAGEPVALCHRCTGILAGLIVGLLAAPLAVDAFTRAVVRLFGRVAPQHRAAVVFALGAAPMTLDWLVTALGLWANTPASRVATGAVFGLAVALLLGRSLLRPPVARRSLSPTPGS